MDRESMGNLLTLVHLVSLVFRQFSRVIPLITYANGSRIRIAIIRLCDSVCLCVYPHDKTKMTETKIAKLGTGIVNHDTLPTNEYYDKGQKGQG